MQAEEIRKFALSLPATNEEPHFESASFRIKGKIFATLPTGGEYAHIFVADEQREMALAMYPEFIEQLVWGKKIWGVRVSLAKAKSAFVRTLLTGAWRRKAPKALLQHVR
ncbi:MAG: MmcQ/YjbR family DNA-binding protein [Gammaproteobacteria bacterium]|nr:MAG: MmcQ/YjbR family DNA-binding protein [Gammaproteobacteria bacterium]